MYVIVVDFARSNNGVYDIPDVEKVKAVTFFTLCKVGNFDDVCSRVEIIHVRLGARFHGKGKTLSRSFARKIFFSVKPIVGALF